MFAVFASPGFFLFRPPPSPWTNTEPPATSRGTLPLRFISAPRPPHLCRPRGWTTSPRSRWDPITALFLARRAPPPRQHGWCWCPAHHPFKPPPFSCAGISGPSPEASSLQLCTSLFYCKYKEKFDFWSKNIHTNIYTSRAPSYILCRFFSNPTVAPLPSPQGCPAPAGSPLGAGVDETLPDKRWKASRIRSAPRLGHGTPHPWLFACPRPPSPYRPPFDEGISQGVGGGGQPAAIFWPPEAGLPPPPTQTLEGVRKDPGQQPASSHFAISATLPIGM